MPDMPAADVDVSVDLVRRLLRDQHPDLAELPLRVVANGWDNVVLRLGDELAVRVPRRALAAVLVEHEQRWLPGLAGHLPVPVPAPVRTGVPALGYPWSWSVVPWFDGTRMLDLPAPARRPAAAPLAAFVAALHRPAPPDAPVNPYRGVPLAARDAAVRERLATGHVPDAPLVLAVWERLLASPVWDGPPLWLHGDLHPGNLVCGPDGTLRAVVDFGDMTAGDPATDLAAAWLVLDDVGRAEFRDAVTAACGTTAATWDRARASALAVTTSLLVHSDDNPLYGELGRQTLDAVLGG
ncbi:aminoglycoside phosphotransferase (APT) family kinase protein [Sediminihabitans luteus]|uniref:Aminoglycoside phosphotransferase (APT) family kinase protein n=1 Tax=Sediminihabitans luteus TaxID=1138585 RepID=A0A2M9CQH9_9CELL|nr:aminoglycoside phosphotransferase family protein [Sediminihabitans luteus]PJJ74098.1 aminoglycoside phosphotransferase (APT) family kinase protein [Sediminihabitans luteus]GII97987.1 aminoglycoside phosphotransferase [Sediminihabitans luteus]